MTVFKAFLRVVEKNKAMIILYTVLLMVFGGMNMDNDKNTGSFTESKPYVYIENDDDSAITDAFVDYLLSKCDTVKLDNSNDDALKDALFYRDISIIITIPEGFGDSILNGEAKELEIQSVGDYAAAYTELLIRRFIKAANVYGSYGYSEEQLISEVNETISDEIEVNVISKLDDNKMNQFSRFFNFMNYSLIAGCVYVICMVMATFREEKVYKRTIISAMDYKKQNRILLLCNSMLVVAMWLLYVVLGIIKLGADNILSKRGGMYMLNALVFALCSLCLAFLISNLVINKNAISGIINVVALGTSFLCGAFVPAQFLPKGVLTIAHILPSYWFINANDRLAQIEDINISSLERVFVNMGVVLGFSVLFIILSNVVSKKKMTH